MKASLRSTFSLIAILGIVPFLGLSYEQQQHTTVATTASGPSFLRGRVLSGFFKPFAEVNDETTVKEKTEPPAPAPTFLEIKRDAIPSASSKGTRSPKGTRPPTVPKTRPPTVLKSTKAPSSRGNSASSSTSSGKGSSKDAPGDKIETKSSESSNGEEEINYELFKDSTAVTLPVAAFLISTKSSFSALSVDFEELAKVVRGVFSEMYSFTFVDHVDYEFVGVYIPRYTVLASNLVDFEINIYFKNKVDMPSLFEVQSVAKQGLQPGNEFNNLLLGKMRIMNSKYYSEATAVHFISNAKELNAAYLEADDGSMSGGTLALILCLSLFGVGCLVWGAYYFYKKRQSFQRTHVHIMEDPIEVKLGKQGDRSNGTSCGTVTSDGEPSLMSSRSQRPISDAHRTPPPSGNTSRLVSSPNSAYSQKQGYSDDDSDDEFLLDGDVTFDEVALEDEKLDVKTKIGEIKKSAFLNELMVTTQSRANSAKRVGEMSPSSDHADDASQTAHVGEINKNKYYNQVTRSVPVTSLSKPWHAEAGPNALPESLDSSHSGGAPKRIFQASSPSAPVNAKINADDDASVFTIDSQSSATPEFLKKFKQMGLKRPKPT